MKKCRSGLSEAVAARLVVALRRLPRLWLGVSRFIGNPVRVEAESRGADRDWAGSSDQVLVAHHFARPSVFVDRRRAQGYSDKKPASRSPSGERRENSAAGRAG